MLWIYFGIYPKVNPYHDVNSILTCYHIRYDPYLGIVRCIIRIITCYCIYFRNAMDLLWDIYTVPKDHSIYYSATKCKYYPIIGKHNNWAIIYFIDKGSPDSVISVTRTKRELPILTGETAYSVYNTII